MHPGCMAMPAHGPAVQQDHTHKTQQGLLLFPYSEKREAPQWEENDLGEHNVLLSMSEA